MAKLSSINKNNRRIKLSNKLQTILFDFYYKNSEVKLQKESFFMKDFNKDGIKKPIY